MRTGIPSFVGTLLVILIDLEWAFSGPINWGSGMCNLGYIRLSMVAKIKVLSNEGTTLDLKIPDVPSVDCVNATGPDQYKLVVAWSSWDSDAVTVPEQTQTTHLSDVGSKSPPKGTTQPHEETTITSTKPTIKTDESTHQTEKSENRDSYMDEVTDSTTETDKPSSDAAQIEPKIDDSTSTTADGSSSDISAVTTDVRSSSAGVSTSVEVADNNEFAEDSTTIIDVTTPSELLPQNSDSVKSKNSQGDPIIAPFLCQHCDSEDYITTSSPLPNPHPNRLTLIIKRTDDYFSVSDIHLRFLAPDTTVFYDVFWKNVNLFPGSVDATHICDEVTPLSFNSHELLLQNVKLAAYLPVDKGDFPEKKADCTLKYGKDEANADFCRNAEVILIVIGTLLGVLFLGSFIFYAAKLYCNSRREREARDALP